MSHGFPNQPAELLASSNRLAVNTSLPHKTPKSMLKNLFSWKKASSAQDDENPHFIHPAPPSRPQTACSKPDNLVAQPPSFFERSRSDTSVPQRSKTRSKSRRRSRSRCRAVWDPPPLFQAYNQAFMHDTLFIPNRSFLDWLPRNTPGRSSAKTSDSTEDDKDENGSPSIGHRRSMSDSSASSLCKKLFFIFENGHILQYKVDGSQDRLPERVLELSRDSVAFASDAIAGQHWVLEICPYGTDKEDGKTASGKMPWSRMSLKSSDNKRLAEKLLIVFDNPDALFIWLIAIRKQIECLGGLEYQPDIPALPVEVKRPTLRHASNEYPKRKNGNLFSRSSSALPLRVDDHSAHEKDLPQLPSTLSNQRSISVRSTATSSVVTETSLDRLRESYSGSSTTGTALSSALSAVSSSPIKETFHSLPNPILTRESKSRIPLEKSIPKPLTSPLHNSFERSPTPESISDHTETPVGPDRASNEVINDIMSERDLATRPVLQVITPDGVVGDTTIPALDHTLRPELKKYQRQAQHNISVADVDITISPETLGSQPSMDRRHVNKPSLSSSRGTYGLFPKKLAIDVKAEPLVVTERNHVPGLSQKQATDHLEISESPITPVAAAFGKNLFVRPNVGGRRPSPIALPHLLVLGELEQPQRSPAVTDAMLNSNFGMMPSGAATQPATPIEIKVPDFSDIQVDQSLMDSVRQIEARSSSPTHSPHSRSLAPRRSLPNFHYGSPSGANPIGPPPSGPLPAVPPVSESRNSRDSTPSKRASTQGGSTRRASTRSSASNKKVRSPPPSFAMPSLQKSSSIPIESMSPDLSDVQDAAIVTTSQLPSKNIEHPPPPPPTIGQVSVISAPSSTSRQNHHKKALSTSSVKSNRSRRGHVRSASSKSIHTQLASLPPVSYFISPPCGSDVNFDHNNKSCFGIRSGTT